MYLQRSILKCVKERFKRARASFFYLFFFYPNRYATRIIFSLSKLKFKNVDFP